jgi:hypothetical protein
MIAELPSYLYDFFMNLLPNFYGLSGSLEL